MSAGTLLGIAACALCTAVLGAVIKGRSRELSLLLSLGGAMVIVAASLRAAVPLVDQILSLTESGGLPGTCLTAMLKAAGLTVAGQLAARLCKDAGEAALAYGVELAAKVAVLTVALPVLVKLLEYLEEILKL